MLRQGSGPGIIKHRLADINAQHLHCQVLQGESAGPATRAAGHIQDAISIMQCQAVRQQAHRAGDDLILADEPGRFRAAFRW